MHKNLFSIEISLGAGSLIFQLLLIFCSTSTSMERNVYLKYLHFCRYLFIYSCPLHLHLLFPSIKCPSHSSIYIYTLHNIKSNMQWPLSAQSDVWCHHNAQPDVSVSPLANVLKSHFSYYDHSHPASSTHWAGPGSSTWRDGSDQFLFRDKLVKLATRGHGQSWSCSWGYRESVYIYLSILHIIHTYCSCIVLTLR